MMDQAEIKDFENDLRQEIEDGFNFVHPIVGDWHQCATGEPYIVFSVKCKINDLYVAGDLIEKGIVEKQGALLQPTPEGQEHPSLMWGVDEEGNGTAIVHHPGKLSPLPYKFALYWRRPPTVDIEGDWATIYCRLCISDVIAFKGQLSKERVGLAIAEKDKDKESMNVIYTMTHVPSELFVNKALKEIKEYYSSLPDEEKKENG